MAVYTYRATGPTDDAVTGTIAADTPRQARDLLRGRGLRVRDVADFRPSVKFPRVLVRPGAFGRSVGRRQTTGFVRDLSTLLGVGMPLLEALETAAKPAGGGLHAAIVLLRDRIAAGASLAGAMREQPRVFDALAVSIADVGEDAGTLDASLERLADFRERADQFTNRLATALIYPLIVSVVGLLFHGLFDDVRGAEDFAAVDRAGPAAAVPDPGREDVERRVARVVVVDWRLRSLHSPLRCPRVRRF